MDFQIKFIKSLLSDSDLILCYDENNIEYKINKKVLSFHSPVLNIKFNDDAFKKDDILLIPEFNKICMEIFQKCIILEYDITYDLCPIVFFIITTRFLMIDLMKYIIDKYKNLYSALIVATFSGSTEIVDYVFNKELWSKLSYHDLETLMLSYIIEMHIYTHTDESTFKYAIDKFSKLVAPNLLKQNIFTLSSTISKFK